MDSSFKETPDILEVKAIPDFTLLGRFSDGSILEWDLKDWVKNSSGPLFLPLKDFNYFSKVFITGRFLVSWPNGLDIDSEEFYTSGKIAREKSQKLFVTK